MQTGQQPSRLSVLQVTVLFMGYVIFDFAWLYLYPTSVPSLSNVILAHHVVTLLLLTFPFRHRDYGHFTCWDGLTELNTWFLVLRRQWSQHRQLWDGLYWVTFIPQRLVMYPALLLKFWMVLGSFPLQERLLVCVCQFLLCCFNFGVFYLSVRRRASKGTDSTVPKQAVSCPGKMDSSAGLKPHQTKNVVIRAHGGTLA